MNDLSLELELEGNTATTVLQVPPNLEAISAAARAHVPGAEALHLFEKDSDEELASVEGRRAIAIVAHRCKQLAVKVDFNGSSHTERFPPSATVGKVLRWATGKRGFNLDDDARPKANLIARGTEQPLPKDAPIGRYTIVGTCNVELDLTLKEALNKAFCGGRWSARYVDGDS